MQIAAIPTMYKGVQYRSRLEARYAAAFDMHGWGAQYEAIDLHGYIPDFMVTPPYSKYALLIEVKGVATLHDLLQSAAKVIGSGYWSSASVGRDPEYRHAFLFGNCPALALFIAPSRGKLAVRPFSNNPLAVDSRTWADAGNAVQYKRCMEYGSELD